MNGSDEIIKAMLKNPTVDIHVIDKKTGVNCFWLAAYYGNGQVMKIFAENGIDTLNVHQKTLRNALHVAVDRNNINIVKMLIESDFPLNKTMLGNATALIMSCLQKETDDITRLLLKAGADPNMVTN